MKTQFILTATTRTAVGKKSEETYQYESDTGAKFKFHAHPTRAWNWVICPDGTNPAGQKFATKIINAFCEAQSLEAPTTVNV